MIGPIPPVKRAADVSRCGRYRWNLRRTWDAETEAKVRPAWVWIMLNPSTADATVDDQTIMRCVDFTHRAGLGGLVVVNLFAMISSKPAPLIDLCKLGRAREAIGVRNEDEIGGVLEQEASSGLATAVAAWGDSALARTDVASAMIRHVEDLCDTLEIQLVAFGRTKSGSPKHPLARGLHRIPDDAVAEQWIAPRFAP